MLLPRVWTLNFVRSTSALVGRSGRVYVDTSGTPQKIRAQRLSRSRVSPSLFELSQELKDQFGDNPRIRTHVDCNADELVLVYDYLKDDLLTLVKNHADLPLKARKVILREIGLGLRDLHARHWIHLDLKPNNVMLDWRVDENGGCTVERVVLSDLDCALKLKGEKLLNHRIGNVMWRSPEGQMGKGIGKPSEVFSFGLVCLYTITGAETLHPDFEQLEKEGAEPEQVILYRLLMIFGPLPPELITHINDEYWGELLTALSQVLVDEDPSEHFEQWGEHMLPNLDSETKRVLLRMTNLDPAKRATMDQIVEDPWWDEVRVTNGIDGRPTND